MRYLRVAMLIASVGLAAAADAQTNWVTQMQFRNRVAGIDSAPLVGNLLAVTATGTYTFTVQVGIFNVSGLFAQQANYGLNNWTANLTTAGLQGGERLGVTTSNSRVSPFTFGPATSFGGSLNALMTGINNVNAARDVSGGATAPWTWNPLEQVPNPQPTLPTNPSPGSNSYTSVWRFQVTVSELSGPDILVNFAGQAGPVVQWAVFGTNPPDDTTPGNVSFLGLTPTPVLRDYAPTTLTLHRVPTPAAAVWLIAAAAFPRRRRRTALERTPA